MKEFARQLLQRVRPNRSFGADGLTSEDVALIERVIARRITYLNPSKLSSIAATCREIEVAGLDGVFIEAGCALGGSTVFIGRLKSHSRPLHVHDVFGMIPAPSESDGSDVWKRYQVITSGQSEGLGGDPYYGYDTDLEAKVRQNLNSFGLTETADNIRLIKGLLQETMLVNGPVAFAHIDVDWYDPVLTSLQRIVPNLVPGGSIILDDYNDWSGCRRATKDYFSGIKHEFRMSDTAGSMKITRLPEIRS